MARLKRPAFSSRWPTSKEANSAATVRASFQLVVLASSTTTALSPSRATRLTATPLRSSPFLRSSAARSVWLATYLSTSTPSIRWMPPCRSRPRLMLCFGGYRYQIEATNTSTTTPTRSQRRLGILVARDRGDTADGRAIELDLDLVGHPQGDRLLGQGDDRAVHAAGGDDAIALLHRRQHALALGLLPLLGPQHDEVEDGEHRAEEDQRLHEGGRPPGATGRRG